MQQSTPRALAPNGKAATSSAPQISAAIIAKDEAAHVADLAMSLRGVVDEVVLLDTGSTDETVELARAAGFRVFHRSWSDDFAEARNAAISHARGQWVLWIDADERLVTEDRDAIRRLVAILAKSDGGEQADGFWIGVDCHNTDDLDPDAVDRHQQTRLFRRSRFHFEGRIHERIRLNAGDRAPLFLRAPEAIRITHLGYTPAIVKAKNKFERNRLLVEAALSEPAREHDDPLRLAELRYEQARLRLAEPGGVDRLVEAVAALPRATDTHQHGTALATRALVDAGRFDEALRLLDETARTAQFLSTFAVIEATALARAGRDGDATACVRAARQTQNRFSSERDVAIRLPLVEAELIASHDPAAAWHALGELLSRPVIDFSPSAAAIARRCWRRAADAGRPDDYLVELAELPEAAFNAVITVLPEQHQRAAAGTRQVVTAGPISEPDPRLELFLPRLAGASVVAGLDIAKARLDAEPALALGIAQSAASRHDATASDVDSARLLEMRALLLLRHVEQAVRLADVQTRHDDGARHDDDARRADSEFLAALAVMAEVLTSAQAAPAALRRA